MAIPTACDHCSFAIPLLVALSVDFDLGSVLYFSVIAPIITFALLTLTVRRRSSTAWLIPIAFVLVSWACWTLDYTIRTHARWLVESRNVKAKVLAQTNPAGELRHLEWDGWGFPGAGDTNVYVVYDPDDSLSSPSRSKSPGNFSGVPCTVYRVRRLEKYWYSLVFYTDTEWGRCSGSGVGRREYPTYRP